MQSARLALAMSVLCVWTSRADATPPRAGGPFGLFEGNGIVLTVKLDDTGTYDFATASRVRGTKKFTMMMMSPGRVTHFQLLGDRLCSLYSITAKEFFRLRQAEGSDHVVPIRLISDPKQCNGAVVSRASDITLWDPRLEKFEIALRKQRETLTACLSGIPKGIVLLDFEIGAAGEIVKVDRGGSPKLASADAECLKRAVADIRAPGLADEPSIVYVFQKKTGDEPREMQRQQRKKADDAIATIQSGVEACGRQHNVTGWVTIRFTVDSKSRAADISIVDVSASRELDANPGARKCIREHIEAKTFEVAPGTRAARTLQLWGSPDTEAPKPEAKEPTPKPTQASDTTGPKQHDSGGCSSTGGARHGLCVAWLALVVAWSTHHRRNRRLMVPRTPT